MCDAVCLAVVTRGEAMSKCDDESPACKQDVKDYNDAAFEKATAEGTINRLNTEIDAASKLAAAGGAAAAGGFTTAAISGWTGIGAGIGLALGFIGTATAS